MEKNEEGTHLTSAFLLTGAFQTERVEEIFQKIVDSQESLRSCYALQDGELMLKVQKHCKIEVKQEAGNESDVQKYIKDFIKPFDLFRAPLMHVKVIQLSDKKYLLLSDLYHGIADGYSCTLITKQFMDLYEGKDIKIKSRTCQECVEIQQSYFATPEYEEGIKYWKSELTGQDYGIVYPLDYQRTEKNDHMGNGIRETVNHQTLVALRKLAKDMKCTLYHVLYGTFAMLLFKAAKKKEFVIGTPIITRGIDLSETVGYLTNTVVIKNKIEDSWTLEKYLEETKIRCAQSVAYNKIPFTDVVSLCEDDLRENRNPIFDTMFVYENGEERVNHIADLGCESVEIPVTQSFFDLSFEVIEEHKKLEICVSYKTSLYKEQTVQKIVRYYKQLLKEILQHPEEKVSYFLTDHEEEWNKLRRQQEAWKQTLQQTEDKKQENQVVVSSYRGNTKLEEELIQYWKENLHLQDIDIHENFFDLGGRSIDAMNLIDKLKEKYAVSIMDLFKYPTIELLAKKMSGEEVGQPDKKAEAVKKSKDARHLDASGQMPIAIIGMAGKFPKSRNVSEFWDNLVKEKECIQFLSKEELLEEGLGEEEIEEKNYVNAKGVLEDAECFDAAFFEYSPKEAEKMDPQIRIFHECAWNALEDAGYTPGSIEAGGNKSQNIGVFAGSATDYTWMTHIYQPTSVGQERVERISLNDKDYMTTRISYKMNLSGPSYGIQTACSSSLTSIHLACRSLELGECEMALAGGVSVMLPKKTGYHYEEGMIFSKDGHCRVFDQDATGTVFSDGAGVVVLKPLDKAVEDKDVIYAVIRGTAANNDGNRKAGYTAPSIEGQAEVIAQALAHANMEPSTITYVEAHGTGTLIGDPIEVEGLKEVYTKKEKPYCALGSLKSNFGHLDAAAGVAGVMKVALALKNHKIPGSINCDTPNGNMHLEDSPFYIPHKTQDWAQMETEEGKIPRRAGVSSLGFGGTNAHIVLEEYQQEQEVEELPKKDWKRLFFFSAKTSAALDRMKQQFVDFLEKTPDVNLDNMAYTLQVGRKAFAYREMIFASTREELLEGLQGENKNVVVKRNTVEKEKVPVVFLFSGQGSQYVNMTRDLYERDNLFREKLDNCFYVARDKLHCETDYKSILFPRAGWEEESNDLLRETKNTQTILFMLEYSMASYLMEMGIRPDVLIGHSLGEYVAACVSGVFSLEDGLRLVIGRAKLMQSMKHGGMDALSVSEADAHKLIEKSGRKLWLATNNGLQNTVVSGSFEELGAFERFLNQEGMDYRRLQTSHAFHSGMMDAILEPFAKLVETIPMYYPKIPYISNLTGTWITDEVLSPKYWCDHLRNTVRFYDGVKQILERKCIFIEVGPGKVLSTLVRQCGSLEHVKSVHNMIRHPKEKADDVCYLMERVGELWCSGVDNDFRRQYKKYPLHKISLPGYPFKGQEFKTPQTLLENDKNARPITEWLYRPCWKMRERTEAVQEPVASVLILATNNHMAECFYKKLKDNGIHCNILYLTNSWETKMQDFLADCQELNQGICILNTIPYSEPTIENCFWELIRQIQILGSSQKLHYYVLTKAQRSQESLVTSLVNGVCSVANKEYENLICTQIDVNGVEDDGQLAELVFAECTSTRNTSCVKYKNGVRLEADEEPFEVELSEESGLCKYGNYVITGGLGDIGRYLADFLIKNYQANLLLLAKTPLPEEKDWNRYLEEQPTEFTSQKIQSVLNWRKQGAHVTVEVCDICDVQAVEEKVAEFEKIYGRIHGVFHTAGIKGEGLIRFKTKESSMEVLKPKVWGTQVLDRVFARRELDIMMLFSSLATITEDAGQADYVAANRYLDAYADWAAKEYPGRKTISVHWDNWKNIGMAHRASLEKPNRSSFFEYALLPSQGTKIIEKVLSGRESQVIVSVQELRKRKQMGKKDNQEALVKNALQGTSIYDRPELSSEYAEPVTKLQKHLAKVWACAFSLKTVGIQDDFFELGGDSLYAIGIVNELKKYYQIDMTDIYNYPTVQQLALKLESRTFNLEQQMEEVQKALSAMRNKRERELEIKEERERYHALCQPYQKMLLTQTKKWKQILLLGGTGYLGIYLLKEIVTQTDAHVVLIVRSNEECNGQSRIYEKFCAYFGEEVYQLYQDRWLVLDGEITEPNFGLDYSVYWDLARSTECIVNASGKVDHYGEYEAFYEANVESVKQIIAFAKTGCKKEIHDMSTKGVATGKIEGRRSILFTEFDTDFGQDFSNYYVDTKHEAERLLLGLRADGFDVNLYRIGDIVYDSEDGHFQENIGKNAVYLLMQSILELDYLPDLPFDFMEFSFVDFVSKAVVALMRQAELKQETYHLLNPFLISCQDLVKVLSKEGFKIQCVEGESFIQYLIANYDEEKKKDAIHNFLTYSHLLEMPMYTEFVIASDKTCCILRKLGIKWKKPDEESLRKMIEYGQEIHFFSRADNNIEK